MKREALRVLGWLVILWIAVTGLSTFFGFFKQLPE